MNSKKRKIPLYLLLTIQFSLQVVGIEGSKVSDIISVSMGIATMIPIAESSPDILITKADKALYAAKKQGRDRYVVL
ncbi:MAG: diguanylate cyclase [Crocosphaera sp.]